MTGKFFQEISRSYLLEKSRVSPRLSTASTKLFTRLKRGSAVDQGGLNAAKKVAKFRAANFPINRGVKFFFKKPIDPARFSAIYFRPAAIKSSRTNEPLGKIVGVILAHLAYTNLRSEIHQSSLD